MILTSIQASALSAVDAESVTWACGPKTQSAVDALIRMRLVTMTPEGFYRLTKTGLALRACYVDGAAFPSFTY